MFELQTKILVGEGDELTEEEKKYVHTYNTKYKLVQYLYLEKMNHGKDSMKLTNFHFTPGDKFVEMPIIDTVNALLNIDLSKAEKMDFGDASRHFEKSEKI